MVQEISLMILEIRSRVFRKQFYVSMILGVNAPAQSIMLATLQSVLVTLSLPRLANMQPSTHTCTYRFTGCSAASTSYSMDRLGTILVPQYQPVQVDRKVLGLIE